jgi:hypothetical protein
MLERRTFSRGISSRDRSMPNWISEFGSRRGRVWCKDLSTRELGELRVKKMTHNVKQACPENGLLQLCAAQMRPPTRSRQPWRAPDLDTMMAERR